MNYQNISVDLTLDEHKFLFTEDDYVCLNLLVHEIGPESGSGPAISIFRKEPMMMVVMESFVDVLNDDSRLTDGSVAMEEHRDLLVHRVGGQQEGALLSHVLWELLILNPFESQRDLYPQREGAGPGAQQLDLLRFILLLRHSYKGKEKNTHYLY